MSRQFSFPPQCTHRKVDIAGDIALCMASRGQTALNV